MTEPNWVALGQAAVAIDYVGGWDSGTPYKVGDVVVYQGVQYIAVNPSTGQTPPAAASALAPRLGETGPVITDCDAVRDNGWYVINTGATNSPDGSTYHLMHVLQSDGLNSTRQIAYSYIDERVWTRRNTSGTWYGWVLDGAIGTTLPASPADGQEYTLVDSLTAPTYQWRFKYVALVADAYKWEFVGGAPAGKEQLGLSSTSTAFVDIVGALFTVPRAGIWSIEFGADCYASAANQYIQLAPKFGAVAAVLTDSAGAPSLTAAGNSVSVMRWLTKTLAASTAIQLQQVINGGTGYTRYVWMKVTPVRVA